MDVVVGGPFCWEHSGEAFLTDWGKQAKLDGL